MLALNLPYPPSVNRYWRQYNGRMIISAAGREYKRAVAVAAFEQDAFLIRGAIAVQIAATAPDNRRRDLDNILKATLDALGGVCYEDDSQIENLAVFWTRPRVAPGGGIAVLVWNNEERDRENEIRIV